MARGYTEVPTQDGLRFKNLLASDCPLLTVPKKRGKLRYLAFSSVQGSSITSNLVTPRTRTAKRDTRPNHLRTYCSGIDRARLCFARLLRRSGGNLGLCVQSVSDAFCSEPGPGRARTAAKPSGTSTLSSLVGTFPFAAPDSPKFCHPTDRGRQRVLTPSSRQSCRPG